MMADYARNNFFPLINYNFIIHNAFVPHVIKFYSKIYTCHIKQQFQHLMTRIKYILLSYKLIRRTIQQEDIFEQYINYVTS